MKKTLFVSLTLTLILCLSGLFGCGDSGVSVSPSPTVSTTGTATGIVRDDTNSEMVGAYVLLDQILDSSGLKVLQSNFFPAITDNLGEYKIDFLTPGTYEARIWASQTDHDNDTNGEYNLCLYHVTIVAGQTTDTNLYSGYFVDPTPVDGYGNLSGRAFENASTMPFVYIAVNRVYDSEANNIETEQTNEYTGTSGNQGEFFIEDIPEGEIEINAWETRADFENALPPVYSGTGKIYSGMTLNHDVFWGNMAGKK